MKLTDRMNDGAVRRENHSELKRTRQRERERLERRSHTIMTFAQSRSTSQTFTTYGAT